MRNWGLGTNDSMSHCYHMVTHRNWQVNMLDLNHVCARWPVLIGNDCHSVDQLAIRTRVNEPPTRQQLPACPRGQPLRSQMTYLRILRRSGTISKTVIRAHRWLHLTWWKVTVHTEYLTSCIESTSPIPPGWVIQNRISDTQSENLLFIFISVLVTNVQRSSITLQNEPLEFKCDTVGYKDR